MNKRNILLAVAFGVTAIVGFLAGAFLPFQLGTRGGFPNGAPNFGDFAPNGQGGQFSEGGFPDGGGGFGERVSGEIQFISADELVISNSADDTTFVLKEETRFSQVGTYAGFAVGDFVQVVYQVTDDQNIAVSVDTFAQE